MTILELDAAAEVERVRHHGYTILRQALPLATVEAWRAGFQRLWDAQELAQVATNRGPGRRYIDLPFAWPFSDPAVLMHPEVLAVVEGVLGREPLLLHIGTDTPTQGSQDQDIHGDIADLFPQDGLVTPPPALAVNFPLVDVTVENGPFSCCPGSHQLTHAEGMRRLADGSASLEPVLLRRGDIMIRDPRMLHRGTTNRRGDPRPVVVLAYQRPWYRHYGFAAMDICPSMRAAMPERMRRMLKLHLEHHLWA